MKYIILLVISLIIVSCGADGDGNKSDGPGDDVVKIWSAAVAEQGTSERLVFEGQLFNSYAVGGENTGYSIYMGGDKRMEIDLATNGLEKEFSEYLFVVIKGKFIEVEEVESGKRVVFEVDEIYEPDDPHIE